MTYRQFLFSQLFVVHIENNETQYQEFEYDIIYPEVVKHYEKYKTSKYFFLYTQSEYECIEEYLANEVT